VMHTCPHSNLDAASRLGCPSNPDALAFGDDPEDASQSLGSHNLKMKASAAQALTMLVATANHGRDA